PRTHELAARLIAAGAEPTPLYEELFERNSLGRLQLMGRALGRLRTLADGRVAYTEVYLSDYRDTGSIPLATEALVNYPRSVAGVEVGLLFIEQANGGVKVSFRSRRADVARVAEQFGGGGHRVASGATVPGPMDAARERVLRAVAAAVELL